MSQIVADLKKKSSQFLKRWSIIFPHVKCICRKDNIGYIHGGCSDHICWEISVHLLTHIDTTVTSKVKMGNGDVIEAKGKGTIRVETKRE